MIPMSLNKLIPAAAFRVAFWCTMWSLGLFSIVLGILSVFGSDVVKWNGAYVHGFSGVLAAVGIAFAFSIGAGVLAFLGAMVMRMAGRWINFGEIHFDENAQEQSE